MNNIQIFMNEFYHYNKKEFWLLIAGNIALGIVINYIPLHVFLQAGVVIIMALKTFSFLRSASVMPSISSDFDRYSWKYFQGLPLSKRELIISLVLSNLFVMFPLLVWLMSFYVQIADLFVDDITTLEFYVPSKIFLAAIPVLLLISTNALSNQIQFPRKQYSKIPARVRFLNTLKMGAIGIAVTMYLWFFYDYVAEYFDFELRPYLIQGFNMGLALIKSWWLSPVLLIISYLNYSSTLDIWQEEKKSYSNIKWIPKRDIPLTALAIILIAAPILTIDWKIPSIYGDSKLLSATYYKDYKKIDQLIKTGHKLNDANFNGFTPLMAAVHEGDEIMYEYLLSIGADTKGMVNIKKNEYLTGMNIFLLAVNSGNVKIISDLLKRGYSANEKNKTSGSHALHIASRNCSSEVVDLLIEKKADLNVINKKKKSALHLAANYSCFSVLSSLLESGINTQIKDEDNKIAMDYIKEKKYNKELVYFVQKKSRAPASKK